MSETTNDLRLIEDYLPIEAISAEASREKSVRKGHISTLHLWWARRPLVACRAAVYGALVPADRWVKDVELKKPPADAEKAAKNKNGKKKGLNRKAAKEFVTKLCRYPKTNPTKPAEVKAKAETEAAIVEAQKHILEAHAERLTAELVEAKETGKPPARVDEFKWPFSFNRDPTGSVSGDDVATPNALPAGSRLNEGSKTVVTYDDIVAGRAPRPRVLDMFAGGGAIPLEALRLGCEAYALDLNPVAHIIQLCTLVYPQKYGKPDPTVRGMTGPKNADGETTWGGLAAEVRYWGNWVLDRVRKEIGDLYPPIPDPEVWDTPPEIAFDRETGQWNVTQPGKPKDGVKVESLVQKEFVNHDDEQDCEETETNGNTTVPLPPGFLQPVAHLWTRTVRCKNPGCAATVPLVRQTWLCKKAKRYVALRMNAPKNAKRVTFEVTESETESGLGFDPAGFSKAGNASCPFCGTVCDNGYVKTEGCAGRMAGQLMAVISTRPGKQGKVYLAADDLPEWSRPSDDEINARIVDFCQYAGLSVPDERITTDAKNANFCIMYGLDQFSKLFTSRQTLSLLAFAAAVRESHHATTAGAHSDNSDIAQAVATLLAAVVDRIADWNSALCSWSPENTGGAKIGHTFGRQALPMVWDFAESGLWGAATGSAEMALYWVLQGIEHACVSSDPPIISRGSATSQPWTDASLDSVITDPPYYDNVPYADISDFFYVWLKRTVGHLYPEHFSGSATPKRQEAVADATRHDGDKKRAVTAYEDMMAQSLAEAARVLKPSGTLAVVYAHKTTLGWSTLVDAFRRAGFVVTEAWPLATEMKSRLRGMDSAALASSIFLIGRKRKHDVVAGNYEDDVQPDLQQIVRERVETLWEMGIAGADLVIACVGAGLRAFTKYEKVEYANGEEVPAEKFLAEVEGVVLDAMMSKLFGQSGATVSAIDPASRFYVLWRFVYKAAEIDAGEAIVFTYAQHVELDGPQGLSGGKDALVEKKKAKYRARDFTERGDNARLGQPGDDGQPAPLIDVLHRVLWLMENSPRKLAEFLTEVQPDHERLRVLAQTLAGAALSGKSEEDAAKLVSTTAAEQAALGKLLANWRAVIENAVVSKAEREDRKRGQERLFE